MFSYPNRLLLLLFLFCSTLDAQDDSINICNKIIYNPTLIYIPKQSKDNFRVCVLELLENGTENEALLLLILSKSYNLSESHSKALHFANKSLEKSITLRDSTNALNVLSNFFLYKNEFSDASIKAYEALEISKRSNDKNLEAQSLLSIMLCSSSTGDSEGVNASIQKIQEIEPFISDSLILGYYYYQKAKILYQIVPDKREIQEIVNLLYKSLDLLEVNELHNYLGEIYDFIALCYLNETILDYNKAEKFHNKRVELNAILDDNRQIALSQLNFCNLLSERHLDMEAIKQCKAAVRVAKKIKSFDVLETAYWNISYLYEENDSIVLAHSYLLKHLLAKDSFLKEENRKFALDLQTQYQTKEKENKIKLFNEKEKVNKIIQNVSLGSVAFFSIISCFIYYLYYQKDTLNKIISDQNKELEQLNKFKNQLFSIMGHDMRGLMHKLNIQQKKIIRTNVHDRNSKIYKFTSQMGSMLDNLNGFIENILYWGLTQTDRLYFDFQDLDMKSLVEQVCLNLKYNIDYKNINIKNDIPSDFKVKADLNTTKVVLRNIIDNAIKYSVKGGNIYLVIEGKNKIKIIDEGQGISDDKKKILFMVNHEKVSEGTSGEKGTGLGLWICQEMMRKNHGEILVGSNGKKGTCFTLSFLTP